MYPTLVTPASWAFAVWGVIFLLEGVSIIRQVGYDDKENALQHAHWYWVYACMLQCCWTIAFATNCILLSNILMAGLMWCIMNAYSCCRLSGDLTMELYLIGTLPFGIHAAWLGVAFVVSVNISCAYLRVSSFYALLVASASLLALPIFSVVCSLWFWDPVFLCVGAWASCAIACFRPPLVLCKHFTDSERLLHQSRCVHLAFFLCGGALCFVLLYVFLSL